MPVDVPYRAALMLLAVFLICLLFYADTLTLEFLGEDYERIVTHAADLETSLQELMFGSTDVSPRFRPVLFLSLALQYRIFGTHIPSYRLVNIVLISLLAFLILRFLVEIFHVRFFPALAASLFAVFHFMRADTVYQYSAQLFLLADLLFMTMLFLTFRTRYDFKHMMLVMAVFSAGLLTLQSVVIFIPLLLYHIINVKTHQRADAYKVTVLYGAALLLPLLAFMIAGGWRSNQPTIPEYSAFQMVKNYLTMTGYLFYNFKPVGFTDQWNAGLPLSGLILFARTYPSLVALLWTSIVFTLAMVFLYRRGDYQTRFLCLGLMLNVFLFSIYIGVTPRYASLSGIFLSALCAHLYSRKVRAQQWWLGLIIVALVFGYNLTIYHQEKHPFVEEITFFKAVRIDLNSNPRLYQVNPPIYKGKDCTDLSRRVSFMKVFWRM